MTKEELNQVQDTDVDDTDVDDIDVESHDDKLPDFDKLWNEEDIDESDSNQDDDEDIDTDTDTDTDSQDDDDNTDADSTDDNDDEQDNDTDSDSTDDAATVLEVKFNKETFKLNKEDAVKYAQLGMVSQKAIEQRDAYKGKLDRIDSIARASGMDLDTFISSVEAKANEIEVENEFNALRQDAKYENVSDEVLAEIANLKVNEKRKSVAIEQREKADNQKTAATTEISKQLDRFSIAHPEVDVNHIQDVLTDEMYDLMDKGLSILEAYDTVKTKEVQEKLKAQETQLKASKQNAENKKRYMGNTKSVADNAGKDPLLDILFSD